MRKFYLVLFLITWNLHSQENLERITVPQGSLANAILEIEQRTGYKFFYLQEWIEDINVSALSTAASLEDALSHIVRETELNYYILEEEKRIFLLEHSIIYDELPLALRPKTDTVTSSKPQTIVETELPSPTFYREAISENKPSTLPVRIGKATRDQIQSTYTLTGRAVNKTSGEPISELVITVQNSNRSVVTDENGNYRIQLPAGYNLLKTRAMGIKDSEREVIIYNNGTLDFILEEGLEQLQEVVVDADALKNVEEVKAGTEQINSDEVKEIPLVLGERNVLQIAQALPGISSAGEGATGINVRGGKADQNLILLDDAVVYNPTHFFGIFQALNPFTTETVNIYKGNAPVEFGGRLSSVFDIESINGNTTEIAGEGSVGPVTANLALEIPIVENKSSLVLGARAAYADWILEILDEESLKNSEAAFYDGIVKYHHRFNEDSELRTTAYYSKDRFRITSDSLYNYSNKLFSTQWSHRISEATSAVLKTGFSDYNFGINFDKDSTRDFALDYGISEASLTYKLRSRLNEAHALEYGANAKYYSVNPGSKMPTSSATTIEGINIDRERGLEGAIFVGDEFNISDKLTLNLGLRYAFFAALGSSNSRLYENGRPKNEGTVRDSLNFGSGEVVDTYGGPEGRISARYLLAPDMSVKASLNNSYQFVHLLTNNTTISPIDTWKLSDYHIEPQTAVQASLGFYKNFDENMYELSVEGFYKKMNNVLDFKTGATLFLNENIETEILQGDGKSYGVEFLLKKSRGDFNGWLSYTYSRSLYKFNSEFEEETISNGSYFPSNFDKPHDVSLIANYRLTRRFSFSLNFAYQTGRPITYPLGTYRFNNSDYVYYSERNKFRIPDYYRLDLGINIEGNHKVQKLAHSFITLQVYNVLGRNNPYAVYFVTENGEVKALQNSIFGVPIPSITYNFKF